MLDTVNRYNGFFLAFGFLDLDHAAPDDIDRLRDLGFVGLKPYKQFKPETFVNPMTGEEEQTTIGGPQVIIKKDRGLAYYVGFALLVVLSFAFFFLPGITITFAVSRLVDLNTSAAWVFSTILSFGVWLIFKLKIKGFEKSFHRYLVLCVVCLVALFAIQFITDYNVISEVVALLIGAKG